MNVLVILQGPAYGDERAYNGLRLAGSLAKRDDVNVKMFCFGTCMEARGIGDEMLIPETRRSTLDEATDWTLWADKTITF